ncbi:solute carrier family 25 member 38 [Nemania sp. FL0916]|nr:solute carrier family 25 member 38 [Nemania sp. FL0916]
MPQRDGQSSSKSSGSFHFVAGLGSGVFGAVLLQPFDLVKTRVQQSGSHSIRSAVRDIARSSTISTTTSITNVRSSNTPNASAVIAAFWRGTVPSALRTGIGSAVYFTTLNTIRQHFASSPITSSSSSPSSSPPSSSSRSSTSALPRLSNTTNLLSGAFARAFAGFILMPLTVIKVRYESSLYTYHTVLGAARDIYRGGGVQGFFAGFGATAMRDAPYAGLYVLSYEQFKKRLSRHFYNNGTGSMSAATVNFASGALAGATCSFISNPFDAVKTRIQLQPSVYRNMVHACRTMVASEGVRSLYDGLALRMTRKAISSALAWMLYEELIRRAESTWRREDTTSKHM